MLRDGGVTPPAAGCVAAPRGNVHGYRDLPEQGQTRFKARFKMSGGGGISLCNAVGRKGSKLEGIRDPLLGRRKPGALHKFWFAGQGAGVMVERMRRALGALLRACLCGRGRRAGPGKSQTLCLPSLRIPLLLCCSDGLKNNREPPPGLRLWDKFDPPAAREMFTKYPWLKIMPSYSVPSAWRWKALMQPPWSVQ